MWQKGSWSDWCTNQHKQFCLQFRHMGKPVENLDHQNWRNNFTNGTHPYEETPQQSTACLQNKVFENCFWIFFRVTFHTQSTPSKTSEALYLWFICWKSSAVHIYGAGTETQSSSTIFTTRLHDGNYLTITRQESKRDHYLNCTWIRFRVSKVWRRTKHALC